MIVSDHKKDCFLVKRLYLLWIIVFATGIGGCESIPKKWQDIPAYYNTYYHFSKYYNQGKDKLILTNIDVFSPIDQNRFTLFPVYDAKDSQKDFKQALQKWNKILKHHSNSSFVHTTLEKIGKIHFYLEDFFSAYDEFTHVLNISNGPSRKVNSILWLSRIDRELGNYSKAKNRLIDFSKNQDEQWDKTIIAPIYIFLAEFYANENNYNQAISLLVEYVDYVSNYSLKERALLLLGHIYIERRDWENAYGIFDRVRKKAKTIEKKYITTKNWAVTIGKLGRYEQAINALKRFRRLGTMEPYYPDIDLDIALLTISQGNLEYGVELIQSINKKYSSINPITKGLVYQSLGDIYFFKYGHFEYALLAYNEAKEILQKQKKTNYFHAIHFSQYIPTYIELSKKKEELKFLLELGLLDKEERKNQIEKKQRTALNEEKIKNEFASNQTNDFEQLNSVENDLYQESEDGLAGVSFLGALSNQLIEEGKIVFNQRWGERELIDNWRFVFQNSNSDNSITEVEKNIPHEEESSNIYFGEEWLAQIPETNQDSLDLQDDLLKIHYDIGLLFFEHFPQVDSAIHYFELVASNKQKKHMLVPKAIVGLINLYEQTQNTKLAFAWEEYLHVHFSDFYLDNSDNQSVLYPMNENDTVSFSDVQMWINIAQSDSTSKKEYLLYQAVEHYILFLANDDLYPKVVEWENLVEMCRKSKPMSEVVSNKKKTDSLFISSFNIPQDTGVAGNNLFSTHIEIPVSEPIKTESDDCFQWKKENPYIGDHWDHIRLLLQQILDSDTPLDELKIKQVQFWNKMLSIDGHG